MWFIALNQLKKKLENIRFYALHCKVYLKFMLYNCWFFLHHCYNLLINTEAVSSSVFLLRFNWTKVMQCSKCPSDLLVPQYIKIISVYVLTSIILSNHTSVHQKIATKFLCYSGTFWEWCIKVWGNFVRDFCVQRPAPRFLRDTSHCMNYYK
jgi:hypothetical protein